MTWTDLMVSRMQQLAHEGYSASHVADRLNAEFGAGVSRNAVIGKMHRLGFGFGATVITKQPKWTSDMEQALKAGFADGLTAAATARHVSAVAGREMTAHAITAKAGSMGITFKAATRKVYAERVLRIRADASLAPDEAPGLTGPITMSRLEAHHCRFIDGPVDGERTRYCGARVATGSYCACHAAITYLPPAARKEKRSPVDDRNLVRRFA